MQQQMRIHLRGLLRGRTAGEVSEKRAFNGGLSWKNSRSWCGASPARMMKRAASAGPQRLSAKRLNLGKPLRRPVPNIAVNCLIGIASSKTILIELLA